MSAPPQKLLTRVEDAVNRSLVALELEGWKPSVYVDKDRLGAVTVRLDKIETAATGISIREAATFDDLKLQHYFKLQLAHAVKNKQQVGWLDQSPPADILDVAAKMRAFDESRVEVELSRGAT